MKSHGVRQQKSRVRHEKSRVGQQKSRVRQQKSRVRQQKSPVRHTSNMKRLGNRSMENSQRYKNGLRLKKYSKNTRKTYEKEQMKILTN